MCGPCDTSSHPVLITKAREAADDILERYFHIHKAWDLSTPSGFIRAQSALARELRHLTSESDLEAVRAAVSILDIDWRHTTAEQRRNLISSALVAAGRKTAGVPRVVQARFGEAATQVVQSVRDSWASDTPFGFVC